VFSRVIVRSKVPSGRLSIWLDHACLDDLRQNTPAVLPTPYNLVQGLLPARWVVSEAIGSVRHRLFFGAVISCRCLYRAVCVKLRLSSVVAKLASKTVCSPACHLRDPADGHDRTVQMWPCSIIVTNAAHRRFRPAPVINPRFPIADFALAVGS
jgi:hypothetical protein